MLLLLAALPLPLFGTDQCSNAQRYLHRKQSGHRSKRRRQLTRCATPVRSADNQRINLQHRGHQLIAASTCQTHGTPSRMRQREPDAGPLSTPPRNRRRLPMCAHSHTRQAVRLRPALYSAPRAKDDSVPPPKQRCSSSKHGSLSSKARGLPSDLFKIPPAAELDDGLELRLDTLLRAATRATKQPPKIEREQMKVGWEL